MNKGNTMLAREQYEEAKICYSRIDRLDLV